MCAAELHQSRERLVAYGLGQLDEAAAQTVAQHLETCADCLQVVSEAPPDDFLHRVREAAADCPEATVSFDVPGQDEYEILRELGRGGMGVVHLARNRRMDRLEALKVMQRSLVERRTALDRFEQEIRSAARLHHPHIVTAYNAPRWGGSLALAMEYVPGEDLQQVVQLHGLMSVVDACLCAYQTALALQHAHEKGMVHRDIKPSNLMLTNDSARPLVKVLDFGLSKATSESPAHEGLTTEGQLLGSLHYIAPEQAIDAASADIRADIYSLGCTLYYLLAGRPPFQAKGTYELLKAHEQQSPAPLDAVRSDVPAALAAVVSKMMEKAPAERFQTPAEAAEAILPFAQDIGCSWPAEGSGRPKSRQARYAIRALLLTAAATIVAFAAFVIRIQTDEGEVIVNSEADAVAVDIVRNGELVKAGWLVRRGADNRWTVQSGDVEVRLPTAVRVELTLEQNSARLTRKGKILVNIARARRRKSFPKPMANALSPSESSLETAGGDARRDPAGFQRLFNGRDTQGWTLVPATSANVSVEDGVLAAHNHGWPCHLFTDRCDYEDFHFRCDFMCENRGEIAAVMGRADPSPIAFGGMRGYLVSVGRLPNAIGGAAASTRLSLSSRERAALELANSEHGMLAANQWHKLDVVVTGGRIQAFVDGKRMIDQVDEGRVFERGALALQFPTNTASRYRNIELQEFMPAPKTEAAADARTRCIGTEFTNVWNERWTLYQHVEGVKWIVSLTDLAGFAQYELAEVARTDDYIDLKPLGTAGALVVRLHEDRVEIGPDFDELRLCQRLVVWKDAASAASLSPAPPASLLPSIDLNHASVRGKWVRFGTRLMGRADAGDPARIGVAYNAAPEYRLTAVALSMRKDDGFYLGLPVGGSQVLLTIDGEDGLTSGLSLVDGKPVGDNATSRRGDFLQDARINTIVCTVRKNRVQAICNGMLVVDWEGPPERLSLPSRWQSQAAPRLFFGGVDEWIQVTQLQLEPLSEAENVPPNDVVKPADGPVDLLARIALPRDELNGRWRMENGALVADRGVWQGRVQMPISVPEDYRIAAIATRLKGAQGPARTLALGLIVDKFQTMVVIDGPRNNMSGLQLVDGKPWCETGTAIKGPLLRDGVPALIECIVHKSRVRVQVDGKQIIDWHGDARRLSLDVNWAIPDWRRIFVGADCAVRFSKLELTAIGPDE